MIQLPVLIVCKKDFRIGWIQFWIATNLLRWKTTWHGSYANSVKAVEKKWFVASFDENADEMELNDAWMTCSDFCVKECRARNYLEFTRWNPKWFESNIIVRLHLRIEKRLFKKMTSNRKQSYDNLPVLLILQMFHMVTLSMICLARAVAFPYLINFIG